MLPIYTSATRHWNPEESKVLSRFRPYLIEGSNLRVILMCSPNAERSVLIPGIARESHHNYTPGLLLFSFSYSAYLETDECGSTIKRIYVRSLAFIVLGTTLWTVERICQTCRDVQICNETHKTSGDLKILICNSKNYKIHYSEARWRTG